MDSSWYAVESGCPVPATHQALVEATQHLGLVAVHYHQPSRFLLHLNALVQALRNITFKLQGEKESIPAFDAWYAKEQALMRSDPLLVRFVAARNIVVKQSGLGPKSSFIGGLFAGRCMKLATETKPPLMTDSADELKRLRASSFAGVLVNGDRSAIGEQLGVERTWRVEELGDGEVLSTCVEALNNLGGVVSRAHAICGSSYRCEPIIADETDMQEVQVLLETDLDPSLRKKWGWLLGQGPQPEAQSEPPNRVSHAAKTVALGAAALLLSAIVAIYHRGEREEQPGSTSVSTTAATTLPSTPRSSPPRAQAESKQPLRPASTPTTTPTTQAVMPEIEISIRCYHLRLPLKVPAGQNYLIVLLNKKVDLALKHRRSFYQINNVAGDTVETWPPEGRREPNMPYLRCDLTNLGKDNITDLTLAFRVKYGGDATWYPYEVFVNPLIREREFSFAIVNECPADTHTLRPVTATARVVGEPAPRDFKLQWDTRAPSASHGLRGAKVAPVGHGCE